MIHFDVMTGKGLGNNTLISGDRKAAERQTPVEHQELLDITKDPEYAQLLSLPPGPARALAFRILEARAIEREMSNPKYWDDTEPRRTITQSSSFIGPIDYDPYSNMAMVQIGNKLYPYTGIDPVRMSDWLNSPSMEDYYKDFIKSK